LRQIQAFAQAHGRQVSSSDDTSPYCQARQRLPVERLEEIFRHTLRLAEQRLPADALWHGHRVKLVDGTGLSMPDTPANQAVYPQESQQKPGCGFPLLRMVSLSCLASGVIVDFATFSQRSHDLQLFNQLRPDLGRNDLLVGDRGFSSYAQLGLLQSAGVHALFRLQTGAQKHGRRSRLKSIRTLGKGDCLAEWRGLNKPPYMSQKEIANIPAKLTVRIIQFAITAPGMRTRAIVLSCISSAGGWN
jgi:hypothetical protein